MLAGATEQVRAEAENAALGAETEIAELRDVLRRLATPTWQSRKT